jgi:hypothetical protein
MVDTPITSALEVMSISSIMKFIENDDINLNAIYQRGTDIWTSDMESFFLDSIYNGIIPTNITLNKIIIGRNISYTCIDGKQRINTMKKFYDGGIPLIKHNNDNDENLNIYFESLSTHEQVYYFLDRKIPVSIYSNLSYDKETDIFNRLNQMKAPTEGELVTSRFLKKENGKKFRAFIDKYNFQKTKNRDTHVKYILNIFYMIYNQKLIFIYNNRKDEFIKKINENDELMQELMDNSKDIIQEYYMSKKILKHSKIQKIKLTKYCTMAFCYLIYDYFKNNYENNYKCMRNIIKKTYNEYILLDNYKQNNTDKMMQKLKNIFNEHYNKIYKNDT